MAIGCYIDRLTYLSSHLSARRQGYHRIHDINHNTNNHSNHFHHNHTRSNHTRTHSSTSTRPSVVIELRSNDPNYQQNSSCNGLV